MQLEHFSDNSHPSNKSNVDNVHQQLFNDPQDFLKTLKADYSKISGGHTDITLPQLQEFAAHGDDEKGRAAAKIAAEHFSQLSDIERQGTIHGQTANDKITSGDLDFAMDMETGTTFKHIAGNIASDVFGAGVISVSGAGMTAIGVGELATGTSVLGGAAFTGVAATWATGGLFALGAGAYLGYQAFKENGRLKTASSQDQKMFTDWMKES